MKITVEFDSLEEFNSFQKNDPVKKKPAESEEKADTQEAVEEEKADTQEAVEEEKVDTQETSEEEKVYTKEETRAILMKVKKEKGNEVLSQLLGSFGASKLTEIDSTDYPEVVRKSEELLNA